MRRPSVVFLTTAVLLGCLGLRAPASAAPVDEPLTDTFEGPDGLVTNEYAYWNPSRGVATSPTWELNSGSLFRRSGAGWTGVPDGDAPDAASIQHTGSVVFRMMSKRVALGNVRVRARIRVDSLVTTSRTPARDWDGVHLWLRYQSEESLYIVSVARRDGAAVIKKKCAGGTSNGGTYVQIGPTGHLPIAPGAWQGVEATATTTPAGTVQITATRAGRLLVSGVDDGEGCPPITAAGRVGIRGDNAEFGLDDVVAGTATDTATATDTGSATETGPTGPPPGATRRPCRRHRRSFAPVSCGRPRPGVCCSAPTGRCRVAPGR